MIVDAVEGGGEVGLGAMAFSLGASVMAIARAKVPAPASAPVARQGSGKARIPRGGKMPVFARFHLGASPAHRPLGGVVVDDHATILKEQAKRWPSAQAISHSLLHAAMNFPFDQFGYSVLKAITAGQRIISSYAAIISSSRLTS